MFVGFGGGGGFVVPVGGGVQKKLSSSGGSVALTHGGANVKQWKYVPVPPDKLEAFKEETVLFPNDSPDIFFFFIIKYLKC